jgi:hypothetical protein
MGLFKKIFGGTNPASDKMAEKEFEQVQSGEINMVYPILKPGDWIGIQAGAIRQTMLGTPENPELVIAFGYDAPANFIFLTHADFKAGGAEEKVNQAFANLENYGQEFEVSTALDGKVLLASGQDFSSEKILCKSHMLKAHELLKANELMVSIPRRRCMMITSKDAEDSLVNTFIGLHKNAWEDDSYGNAPIYNGLFIVIDGQIDGVIPLGNKI